MAVPSTTMPEKSKATATAHEKELWKVLDNMIGSHDAYVKDSANTIVNRLGTQELLVYSEAMDDHAQKLHTAGVLQDGFAEQKKRIEMMDAMLVERQTAVAKMMRRARKKLASVEEKTAKLTDETEQVERQTEMMREKNERWLTPLTRDTAHLRKHRGDKHKIALLGRLLQLEMRIEIDPSSPSFDGSSSNPLNDTNASSIGASSTERIVGEVYNLAPMSLGMFDHALEGISKTTVAKELWAQLARMDEG